MIFSERGIDMIILMAMMIWSIESGPSSTHGSGGIEIFFLYMELQDKIMRVIELREFV